MTQIFRFIAVWVVNLTLIMQQIVDGTVTGMIAIVVYSIDWRSI
jgi:hypothetical protein